MTEYTFHYCDEICATKTPDNSIKFTLVDGHVLIPNNIVERFISNLKCDMPNTEAKWQDLCSDLYIELFQPEYIDEINELYEQYVM